MEEYYKSPRIGRKCVCFCYYCYVRQYDDGQFVVSAACSLLNCPPNTEYLRVTKRSGNNAYSEKFALYDSSERILEGPEYEDNTVQTDEFCISKTNEPVYKLHLYSTFPKGWSLESWIQILGIYNNTAFIGSVFNKKEMIITLSLFTPIHINDSWKYVEKSANENWKEYSFDDSSWSIVDLSKDVYKVYSTVYLRHLFRGRGDMSAVEMSVLYKSGIIVYLNGNEVFRDHLPNVEITESTTATKEDSLPMYHSIFLPSTRVNCSDSIVAVELHPILFDDPYTMVFNAWLAFYGSSIEDALCYVLPPPDENMRIYDFLLSTSVSIDNTTINYTYSPSRYAYVNAIEIGAEEHSANPLYIHIDGMNQWGNNELLLHRDDMILWKHPYQYLTIDRSSSYYSMYKLHLASGHAQLVSELHFLVCEEGSISIAYPHATYSFYATYELTSVVPMGHPSNCTIQPALPQGLAFDMDTCSVSGIAKEGMKATSFTVTNALGRGTFSLGIRECNGMLFRMRRDYKENSADEVFYIYDNNGATLYSMEPSSSQVDFSVWNETICIEAESIHVTIGSKYSYWSQGSWLSLYQLFPYNEQSLLLHIRYDNEIGLPSDYLLSTSFYIKPQTAWFFTPQLTESWLSDSVEGWKEYTSFPPSSSQLQFYKRFFYVNNLDSIALILSLRYYYGCVIAINSRIVFKSGVTLPLTSSSISTHSYDALMYRTITLPVYSSITNTSYITIGNNWISIGIVAASSAQTQSFFDCSVQPIIDATSSRILDCDVTMFGIEGSARAPLDWFVTSSIYSARWSNGYMIQFSNDRKEWLSSISISNWYKGNRNPHNVLIEARNDEEEWIRLKTVTDMFWLKGKEEKILYLENENSYNQYRLLNITNLYSHWVINRFDFRIDSPYAPVDNLFYENAQGSLAFYRSITIPILAPTDIAYSSFQVNPPLPEGIRIDSNNGIIYGTPRVVSDLQSYTIFAKKYNGEHTEAVLQMAITLCGENNSVITVEINCDEDALKSRFEIMQNDTIVASVASFPHADSTLYFSYCLPDALYLFRLTTPAAGWKYPSGYRITIEDGAIVLAMGEVSDNDKNAEKEMVRVFTTFTAFKRGYSIWHVYNQIGEVDSQWYETGFDDSNWQTTYLHSIGVALSPTLYYRYPVAIPSTSQNQVLNIHMVYRGSIRVFANGELSGLFFLQGDNAYKTIHVSRLSLILPIYTTTPQLIIAIQHIQPLDQPSTKSVCFDATGVFDIEDCSNLRNLASRITASKEIENPEYVFDINPVTAAVFPGGSSSFLEWTIDNEAGSRFNSIGFTSPSGIDALRVALYGRYTSDEEYSLLNQVTLYTIPSRTRISWVVPLGMTGFRQYRWVITNSPAKSFTISSLFALYCRSSSLCSSVDHFPPVPEGELSPLRCPANFSGYLYRWCKNGVLGRVQQDRCGYKKPQQLQYEKSSYYLIKNVLVEIAPPQYLYYIERFSLSAESKLPSGLSIDQNTGRISGTPTKEETVVTTVIVGENTAGSTSTTISFTVRYAHCKAEGVFPQTEVNKEAEYDCSIHRLTYGVKRRKCVLGDSDGVWMEPTGFCLPIEGVLVWGLLSLSIIAVTIYLFTWHSKKKPRYPVIRRRV